jgi:hypothetical protein
MTQANFTISNSTATTARSNINSAFAALQSLSSGTGAPSDLVPYMLWYDTTNDALKMRNDAGATGDDWLTVFTVDHTNDRLDTVTAVNFNTVSDFKYKQEVTTYSDALQTINALRGVSFEWKDTGKKSAGVIAQELEQVIPELVETNDKGDKSVTYIGIIGVLIEAVKELSDKVEALENGV